MLTYSDIADIDGSPDPEHQALVRQYWREQQDLLLEQDRRLQQADQAWESWIQTPEAIFEIINDPDLATRPSERVNSLQKLKNLLKRK